jgi:hypothetical protein
MQLLDAGFYSSIVLPLVSGAPALCCAVDGLNEAIEKTNLASPGIAEQLPDIPQ